MSLRDEGFAKQLGATIDRMKAMKRMTIFQVRITNPKAATPSHALILEPSHLFSTLEYAQEWCQGLIEEEASDNYIGKAIPDIEWLRLDTRTWHWRSADLDIELAIHSTEVD